MLELVLAKLPSELQSRSYFARLFSLASGNCESGNDGKALSNRHFKSVVECKQTRTKARPAARKQSKTSADNQLHQSKACCFTSKNQAARCERNQTLVCLLCKEDHRLAQCKQFISLSLEERANMVKQWSCCLRCLSKGHLMRDCISRKKCNVEECSASHHPLLHGAPGIFQTPQSDERNKEPTKKNIGTHWLQEDSTTTLLFTVPIYVESNGIRFESVALLDEGSQTSLIVKKLSKKLKLKGPRLPSPLSTYHGMDPKDLVRKVSFNVLNSDTSRTFQVKTAFTVPRLQAQSAHVDWSSINQQWSHLVDIQPINTGLKRVEVLLGPDVLGVHDVLESRYPSDDIDAPDGIKTHFGWCIAGPVPTELIKFNPNIN